MDDSYTIDGQSLNSPERFLEEFSDNSQSVSNGIYTLNICNSSLEQSKIDRFCKLCHGTGKVKQAPNQRFAKRGRFPTTPPLEPPRFEKCSKCFD